MAPSALPPLIITAAITGKQTALDHVVNWPISLEQQVTEAAEAVEAGAAIIHLPIRMDDENPTQVIGSFAASVSEIQRRCGTQRPVIQLSAGRSVDADLDDRKAVLLELHGRYEMATLNLGTMNFFDDVFFHPDHYIMSLAGLMMSLQILPELEVYDLGHLWTAERLVQAGLVSHPACYTFTLGVQGGMKFSRSILKFVTSQIPAHDVWSVAGIGRDVFPAASMAIEMGGHVRVGSEDNVSIENSAKAENHAQLVRTIVNMAKRVGRRIATPADAREILGLNG
jgi:3-keto-5-aminohexanoate cleavage enzyme